MRIGIVSLVLMRSDTAQAGNGTGIRISGDLLRRAHARKRNDQRSSEADQPGQSLSDKRRGDCLLSLQDQQRASESLPGRKGPARWKARRNWHMDVVRRRSGPIPPRPSTS